MQVSDLRSADSWRPQARFNDPALLSHTLTRRILPLVNSPGRYVGGELGATRQGYDPGGANILLTFPDAYEVGMSHQGMRILYTLLQQCEGVFCDLAYAPWPDMEQLMRAEGLPLYGLESRRPAAAFDLVGFSLGYELAYTNLLTMIDLTGSPLPARERGLDDPIFLAGGSCVLNPTVVGPFLDVVFLGDGEEILPAAARLVKDAKAQGQGRAEILTRLRALPGAWHSGSQEPVRASVITDMNAYPPPQNLVPVIEPVHDRLALEVMRGCVRGCRFCQAGMITRPVRERDVDAVVGAAREGIAASGYSEVSLLSLSTADYSGLAGTLSGIQSALTDSRTNVVLPSLRVDALDEDLYACLGKERPKSFTFAPEAGSQRLRDVINKNISEPQILTTARAAFSSCVKSIKLYFMIGLPTETPEDLEAIIDLVDKVVGLAPRGGAQVHVSISPFAPKAHTPFQWSGQISRQDMHDRNQYLGRQLGRLKVKVSLRAPEVSYLEGLLGLGDEALAPVVAEAWRRGARFDGWDEQFRFPIWEEALTACQVAAETYLQPKDPQAPLPWDGVDVGVEKSFLQRDWERAQRGQVLPDCRLESGCYQCGPCGEDLQHLFAQPSGKGKTLLDGSAESSGGEEISQDFDPRNADPANPAEEWGRWRIWRQLAATKCWYRVEFAKTGDMAFLGHLDFQRQLQLALRRSGLPVAYSKGYHPHPLFKFGPPLPVGIEGVRECMDLAFTHACPDWQEPLNHALPEGLLIHRQIMVGSQTPASIDQIVERFDYQVELPLPAEGGPEVDEVQDKVGTFLAAEAWPYLRRRPKGDVTFDIRALVPEGALFVDQDSGPGQGVMLRLSLLRGETGAMMPVKEFLTALLDTLLPEPRFCRIVRLGYSGRHNDGRWLSPFEEVGEFNLRGWLSRHFNG